MIYIIVVLLININTNYIFEYFERIMFLKEFNYSFHQKEDLFDEKFKPLAKSVQQFGAKGDGITDDTEAIIKALNSKIDIIVFPKTNKYYKYNGLIIFRNIYNKRIVATGAKILNKDLNKAGFLFEDSKNITIEGGQYGYSNIPKKNGGNSQHVLQFNKCQNIVVSKINISNSPEMGIAITNCNNVTVKKTLIENTFRDGTYSHYSSNVKYIDNIYKNIRDDAMSFHDYGVDLDKVKLKEYGYNQSTGCLASGNTVINAYQGFASIGSKKIIVKDNAFKNIVLAGVAIFNSKELYDHGTAYVTNVLVINNTIFNACSKVKINDSLYTNSGQASTGRASIFIGSLGSKNQINSGESKRLYNINIERNKVSNSGAHGLLCKDIDTLNIVNNVFLNCSGLNAPQSLSGDVVEVSSVTNFWADTNSIIDNRKKVRHQHGYTLVNVSGSMKNWYVKGYLSTINILYGVKPVDLTKMR